MCSAAYGTLPVRGEGDELTTFATITTEANRQLSQIQPRMPVIIEKADWPVWLGEVEGNVPALLRPAPETVLRLWLADKRVGNVKNNGPELLEQHGVETAQPAMLVRKRHRSAIELR